jgi:DNA-binding HxlR family transcriptional regulator
MLTRQQQLFLLELLFHGKLRRKDVLKKPIFCNDSDFYKQVKELINFGYIVNHNLDHKEVEYILTRNGWAFTNILACQSNTDKKYKKIAKEISWLP